MSESRKPKVTLRVRFQGKKAVKIDLFPASEFPKSGALRPDGEPITGTKAKTSRLFRMRVNGRWFPVGMKKVFYTRQQVMDMLLGGA
ncbi:hypothetical protein [Endozoicomonas sp. ALC066]|uniref:hypothetical protein n=1 Tax=Endozoicomonas sp. ALC066 TaxID=3403078 RepID=UPI003BB7BC65